MAMDVGTLAYYLDLDTDRFDRKMRQPGKFKPLGQQLAAETKAMQTQVDRDGTRVGQQLADGIVRGADGRLRDSSGKFIKGFGDGLSGPAEKEGERTGRRWVLGFGRSLTDGSQRLTARARTMLAGLADIAASAVKPAAATAALAFVVPFLGQVAAGLASGGKKIAAGLGAGLALLPAIALTGGLALGAVKIGLSGISEAFAEVGSSSEDFEAAIEGLAPPARAFMREVRGLRGEMRGLKNEVQGNLFRHLIDNVQPLGERYLPTVRQVLGDIADSIGRAGSRSAGFLSQPDTALRLAGAMFNARDAIDGVVQGLPNLVRALVPVISVGATFLPQFTEGWRGLTARIADAAREGEKTGAIRDFIQRGIDGIRGLIETGGTLVSIIQNIGSIGSTVFDAIGLRTGGILEKVDGLTESFDRWLKSADGTRTLATVMEAVRLGVLAIKGPVAIVFGAITKAVVPLLPKVEKFVAALGRLADAVIDVGLDVLEPAIMGIGRAVGFVLPFLTSLASWLADNKPVLQGIGIAILTMLVPAFISWAISAGAAALATLLAIGPILLVGAAIAALAALVIIHFDTIQRWISTAFNWVRDNWPKLLLILTGPFGLAYVLIRSHWDKIKGGATAAKDWVLTKLGEMKDWVVGLPGKLASGLSGLWDGILTGLAPTINSAIRLINRLIEGYNRIPGLPNIATLGTIGGGRAGRNASRRSHLGELVPGGANNEFARVVQGGEEILSRHDPRNARNHPSMAAARRAAAAGLGAVGDGVQKVLVYLDGSGLLQNIRYTVRAEGGGDVQAAFGS